MKNTNLIINGVLAAAVIALFVLYFTDGKTNHAVAGGSDRDSTSVYSGDLKIAYFNVDTVLTKWQLYFQMQEEITAKQLKMEAEFEGKSQAFMKRVEDAQYKMQRGLVTRAEAEQLQLQLQQEEQTLLNLQNTYGAQLQEEGVVKNRQMIDKLEQYLKEYNANREYTYIFSYSFGGNLLYGDKAFDITSQVVEGLNKEYEAAETK